MGVTAPSRSPRRHCSPACRRRGFPSFPANAGTYSNSDMWSRGGTLLGRHCRSRGTRASSCRFHASVDVSSAHKRDAFRRFGGGDRRTNEVSLEFLGRCYRCTSTIFRIRRSKHQIRMPDRHCTIRAIVIAYEFIDCEFVDMR